MCTLDVSDCVITVQAVIVSLLLVSVPRGV
jgi:hypothetical protein